MNEIKYIHTTETHNTKAAEAFIPTLLNFMPQLKSVIDIGCGLGTWLKVFKEMGIGETKGVDGFNVDKSKLAISEHDFIAHDLRLPLDLQKKYDLAICLEVAEHLPDDNADNIIDILTKHSDNILFSAALPYQGGQNHLNEQPFEYWIEKFNNRGFIVKDLFRNIIWNNRDIDWWYRQNMLLATRSQSIEEQPAINVYYHPDLIILKAENEKALHNKNEEYAKLLTSEMPVKKAFQLFYSSVNNRLRKKS